MMRVNFNSEVYTVSRWFPAWLTKNGHSRKVMVGLPYYTWKKRFEEYCAKRGFTVTWV